MSGQDIRLFFRELFGSRLVDRLEFDILALRSDYDARLKDKDEVISSLRTEKAVLDGKVALYERSLLPTASRAGAEIVAHQRPIKPNWAMDFSAPPVKSRWQQTVEDHEKRLQAEEEAEKNQQETTNGG